jgi:hypothetical protein
VLKQALQQVGAMILMVALCGMAIFGAYKSSYQSLQFPTATEINQITNVGVTLSSVEKIAVQRSRSSAVQIMSVDINDGGISVSSGTYIKYRDNYFVLSTSHGIGGLCNFTQIVVEENLYDCVRYVFRDPQTDYIVIQINEIKERNPIRLPQDAPQRDEWISDLATQNTIFYTGFPNEGGPYTFDGKIVGYREDEALFIDSYGWSGSSGSGVFSASGNLIGYIMALEVGETYFGREVLENFIWVIPLFNVDWLAVGAFAD